MKRTSLCLVMLLASSSIFAATPTEPDQFVNVNGARVHYRNYGSGPDALVFVHGWACDMSVWDAQVVAFANTPDKIHVVLVDLPGHGQSGKPEAPLSMDIFADGIAAAMKDAGVERAVLVGHSMGTPVIRQFLRQHPEKTLALVAVDGPFRSFKMSPEQSESFLAPFRKPDYADSAAKFIGGMFHVAGHEAIRDRDEAMVRKTSQATDVEALQAMLDPKIWTDEPIKVPLLVVYAKSTGWRPDDETFVKTLSPTADYRLLDGTGHFLMQEKPAEFDAILRGFLEKNHLLMAKPTP